MGPEQPEPCIELIQQKNAKEQFTTAIDKKPQVLK